jgi:hypothetical protein
MLMIWGCRYVTRRAGAVPFSHGTSVLRWADMRQSKLARLVSPFWGHTPYEEMRERCPGRPTLAVMFP